MIFFNKISLFLLGILLFSSCYGYIPQEITASGDCVDRAVSIRQDLRSKGYKADIVLEVIKINNKKQGHALVRYRKNQTKEWKYIRNLQ